MHDDVQCMKTEQQVRVKATQNAKVQEEEQIEKIPPWQTYPGNIIMQYLNFEGSFASDFGSHWQSG